MYVNYLEVGKRIAARRKALGLRQYQVNEQAGLSDKYLSNIETARSIPSIDVLMRICDVLDTTPNHLLIGAIMEDDNRKLEEIIQKKLKRLDRKKQLFICNFMDWLEEQDE